MEHDLKLKAACVLHVTVDATASFAIAVSRLNMSVVDVGSEEWNVTHGRGVASGFTCSQHDKIWKT